LRLEVRDDLRVVLVAQPLVGVTDGLAVVGPDVVDLGGRGRGRAIAHRTRLPVPKTPDARYAVCRAVAQWTGSFSRKGRKWMTVTMIAPQTSPRIAEKNVLV